MFQYLRTGLAAFALALGLAGGSIAQAQTVGPSNDNTGTVLLFGGGGGVISRGWHNFPISTGKSFNNTVRGYITFGVPSSASPYVSATLRLGTAEVYEGPNTLEVFDVGNPNETDPDLLYADVGTGVSYGTLANLDGGQVATLTLNTAGLAAVNAARGSSITFGLVNATIDPFSDRDQIFGNSGSSLPRELVLLAVPPPAVTGLSPAYGARPGGTSVVISGANLGSALSVTVGGQAATITANTATSITIVTPAGSLGVADVRVTTLGGTSANTAADDFNYIDPVPTLSEWAMILFGLILAGVVALHLQRSRFARAV